MVEYEGEQDRVHVVEYEGEQEIDYVVEFKTGYRTRGRI